MIKALTITGLMLSTVTIWSVELYWDEFYEMSHSLEEAKSTPLTSNDPVALKKAGVYFFSITNGANGMKIDKKNLSDNGFTAMEYLEKAAKLDSKNPILTTWKAVAVLGYAGVTKKLSLKIKYANEGINLFNRIPSEQRNNLDYLFMRIISFSNVPKSFKNLTDNIKNDAKKYYKLYATLEPNPDPETFASFRETIKTIEAWAYYLTKDKDRAKEILQTVDEKLLLISQGKDTSTAEKYYKMMKKLKIK